MREQCLQNIGIEGVRSWAKGGTNDNVWDDSVRACSIANATSAVQKWNSTTKSYGECEVRACDSGYTISSDKKSCVKQ